MAPFLLRGILTTRIFLYVHLLLLVAPPDLTWGRRDLLLTLRQTPATISRIIEGGIHRVDRSVRTRGEPVIPGGRQAKVSTLRRASPTRVHSHEDSKQPHFQAADRPPTLLINPKTLLAAQKRANAGSKESSQVPSSFPHTLKPRSQEEAVALIESLLTDPTTKYPLTSPIAEMIYRTTKDRDGNVVLYRDDQGRPRLVHPAFCERGSCANEAFTQAAYLTSGYLATSTPAYSTELTYQGEILADFKKVFGFVEGTNDQVSTLTYHSRIPDDIEQHGDFRPKNVDDAEKALLELMEDGQIGLYFLKRRVQQVDGEWANQHGHVTLVVRLGNYIVHINNQDWDPLYTSLPQAVKVYMNAVTKKSKGDQGYLHAKMKPGAWVRHQVYVLNAKIAPTHYQTLLELAGHSPPSA